MLNVALVVAALCTAAPSAMAQAAPEPRPQRPRPSPTVSPEVHPDRTVTFRLRASKASEVTISGDIGPSRPLIKGDDGVWSVTVGPLAPDLYDYAFSVDGMRTIDTNNT